MFILSLSDFKYYSSFWHGCPNCYRGEAARKLRLGSKTMDDLYAATQQRLFDLENLHGYEVHSKWECEFRQELRHNDELQRAYEEIFIPGPLDPRIHALRGGRTEPFAFSHVCSNDEEILLLDIV